MKCYQYGSDVAERAARCASTGPPAAGGGRRPRRGGECRAARPALVFRFDAARWTVADRVAGGATIMLLVLLFLPLVLGERRLGNFTASSSADALTAHGCLYLVLPLARGYSAT